MKIRRFVAKDMRSALAQIKDELGVDAVIMSNKKIPEGVELMAAIDYSQSVPDANRDIADKPTTVNVNAEQSSSSREIPDDVINISQGTLPTTAQEKVSATDLKAFGQKINNPEQSESPSDSLSALLNRQVQQNDAILAAKSATDNRLNTNNNIQQQDVSLEQQLKSFTDRLNGESAGNTNSESSIDTHGGKKDEMNEPYISRDELHSMGAMKTGSNQAQNVNTTQVSQTDFEKMQQEMASIRQLLEHQVSGLMWQDVAQKDPQRAVLVNRLLTMGLNDLVADQIAGYVPANMNEEQAWQHVKGLISQQINTTKNDIIHRGGVVALVGPTGVGKTTTIAKLAARFAQIHGADNVALISTDTYRIAGFEQLTTYGRIIGCQVKLAKDASALDALLQQFSQKKLILIDTAGMGQRDMRLSENLTTLVANSRVTIRNYLVLAANTQQQVMQENVDRFKKIPLSGCIYTKLDESVSVGEIISTSIQNGLPIGYLTDGQRVPEDIKIANAEKLVALAEKMASKKTVNSFMPMPTAPEHQAIVV